MTYFITTYNNLQILNNSHRIIKSYFRKNDTPIFGVKNTK